MSTIPGALEVVREAFDRMRTPVAVDVPSSREERAAAWGRLKETLVNWTVPTDDPAFTEGDRTVVVRWGLPTSVREVLESRSLGKMGTLNGLLASAQERLPSQAQISGLPPVNEHGNHFAPHPYCARCDGFHGSGHCLASKSEPEEFVFRTKLPEGAWRELRDAAMQPMVDRALAVIERRMADMRAELATLTEAYDRRGQTIRELYEERDRAQAQIATFTAQNVRPLDEKPEPAPIFRAIAPSRTDPRRLGLA